MKNLLISLIVIGSLFLSGCPKKTYRTAKEQSAQIQIYGIKLIEANIAAYKAGELTQAQFAELTTLTGRFRDGVAVYRAILNEAEKQVRETGAVEPPLLNRLESIFTNEVVNAFLAITQKFALLSPVQSETVKNILAGIRLAILAIQGAFAEVRLQKGEAWT
jgi:hypothetical protein